MCEGECCSNGKSPPWFSVTLPNPTYDDIEVRICGDEGTRNEDTNSAVGDVHSVTSANCRLHSYFYDVELVHEDAQILIRPQNNLHYN